MSPEEFEQKIQKLAYKYFYKEDKSLHEKVEVSFATIEALSLMVEALAENGFEKAIFIYKNFIEE